MGNIPCTILKIKWLAVETDENSFGLFFVKEEFEDVVFWIHATWECQLQLEVFVSLHDVLECAVRLDWHYDFLDIFHFEPIDVIEPEPGDFYFVWRVLVGGSVSMATAGRQNL